MTGTVTENAPNPDSTIAHGLAAVLRLASSRPNDGTGILRRTVAALLAVLLFSPQPSRAGEQATTDPVILLGAELYGQNCATCHYDGSGSTTAPDLLGSQFWKNPPQKLAGIILRGQSRVSLVDGKPFNGIMPPMPYLTDEEIAAIASYVYTVFGQQPTKVDPATVAAEREAPKASPSP